jgi:HEAT repeat protein
LIEAVTSGKRAIQWHAAAALGSIEHPHAAQLLTASLKQGRINVVAAAYSFFLRKGDPASVPALIEALNEYGESRMARDYMFCGNSLLAEAARQWASRNKLEDIDPPEGQALIWGSEK